MVLPDTSPQCTIAINRIFVCLHFTQHRMKYKFNHQVRTVNYANKASVCAAHASSH